MSGGAPEIRGLDWFSGGPVGWYFLFIYVAAVLLAVFVVADCLRPKRAARLAALPEPRWIYLGFQAAFLTFALFGWVPPLPRWVAVIPVVMTPFALAEQVAYLLRVVFPKASPAPADEPAEDPADAASVERSAPGGDSDNG
jgi:hypothetical protein